MIKTLLILFLSCSVGIIYAQNIFPSSGNVGIGTNSPTNALSIKGRVGIRADALPSTLNETLRIEGAINSEENILNVTNMADQDFGVRLSAPGAAIKRTIIGPSVSNRFSLGLGIGSSNEYLTIINGGNVGIGTTSPDGFQVNASLFQESGKGVNNIRIGVLGGTPRIILDSNGNTPFEIDNNSGQFRIFTPGATKFVVNSNGYVGVGTGSPDQLLTVNGTIHSKEVKVDLSVPGPDYVFEKSYALPSLEEVKSYIDENKHLPEIPSAKEMEKNGINLSEMNMLLLKKVEELTLYLIELKKENNDFKSRIEKIENRN